MEKFSKYPSIDNINQKIVDAVYGLGYADKDYQWCVTEKCHGANFQITTDNGIDCKAGKRTAYLEENELKDFFRSDKILDKYKKSICKIFRIIGSNINYYINPEHTNIKKHLNSITVYGELFGGAYDHKDVSKINDVKPVQKGIYYNPDVDFYPFDIKITWSCFGHEDEVHTKYLKYSDSCFIFSIPHLEFKYYAKPLLIGSFKECAEYPNEFITTIPEVKKFPEIEDNICEGIVIRAYNENLFFKNNRIIIKNKNDRWSEKTHKKSIRTTEVILPDYIVYILEDLNCYINENRYNAVVSKIGEVTAKDFGMIMKNMISDIYKDYMKDVPDAKFNLDILTKSDRKRVNKIVTNNVAKLVKLCLFGSEKPVIY